MGWKHVGRVLCALAIVGAAVLLTGGRVDAATAAPDGTWISWTGTSDGIEFTVTLTCATAGSCTVETTSPRLEGRTVWKVSEISGTTFRGSFAKYGDLCAPGDSAASTGGTFRLDAGATSAELVVDVDNREVQCGKGAVQYLDSSGKGRFVGGSACVVSGTPCPPAPAPTATPTPTETLGAAAPISTPIAAPAETSGGLGLVPGTGSQLGTGSPAASSVLWTLPTTAQAPVDPVQLALAALVTVILVLLVSFPTALLNSAVEGAPERFAALTSRLRGGRHAAARAGEPPASDRAFSRAWWIAAAGVIVAGVVSAFVDPQFGLNVGSVRVLIGIVIGFAVEVVVGWAVMVQVARRIDASTTVSYRFAPFSLLVVALAVLFTRITHFQPGVIFGLVAGVVLGTAAAGSVRGRIALVLSGYALGVGLVGWVLYSALGPALAAHPSFWGGLAIDTLSSLAMAGVAATPIILLPLRGLAGGDVFAWNRWVWAAVYVAGLLVFFFVLMPMPYSWAQVTLSLETWIGIYVVYALVAVGLWLVVARPWRKDETDAAGSPPPADEPAPAATLEG